MNTENELSYDLRLEKACEMGHLEIIQEHLMSHNVNDFLCSQRTLLLHAASYAQAEVIEYLITNGADVNKCKRGYTPLMSLCSSTTGTLEERMKCLTLLIQAKADADAFTIYRETALMFACQSQEPEFVAELIKHVKNINVFDHSKRTALMYATIANKSDIVKILIENSADITIIDYDNLRAIDVASIKGFDKILALLNSNGEEEEVTDICEISKLNDWKDMFPSLININDKTVDFDVHTILHGMGLEAYNHLFQGINLKTFLKLTESDLSNLGIDISAHRVQFMTYLHKFHRKKWSIHSIGVVNKSLPYTLYDGIVSLGTAAKQVAVISASFEYIKNTLANADKKKIYLHKEHISHYEQELRKAKKTLDNLQKELIQVKSLSKKINKENDIGIPATYIGPKRYKVNWTILLSISVILGLCVTKKICIPRLLINQ